MNCAMKMSVGKLIADVLQYYYFDRYICSFFAKFFLLVLYISLSVLGNDYILLLCSDSVVEEAAGEDPSGKSFKERDEDGFREFEVYSSQQCTYLSYWLI